MSIHKRIQTLTNFILQLEQHSHIPEIKKQIETLKTALKTLKAFSNDKTILKTTLQVMKQTLKLIEKYGVQLNTEINNQVKKNKNEQSQQTFPARLYNEYMREKEINNVQVNEERDKELNDDEIIDGRCDGGIGGGYGGGEGLINEYMEMGGGEVESHIKLYTENFPTDESSKNIQKKFTIEELQTLPIAVITNLNIILTKFRRSRNAKEMD